jgi:predicted nucleotidyltransferase
MSNEEMTKRTNLALEQLSLFRDFSDGIILVGSVAHAESSNITKNSDLDLIVIVEGVRKTLPVIMGDKEEQLALKNRFFEGYCLKKTEQDVPISLHVISKDAFDIICKCFVADIRVYRPKSKEESYSLRGFEGNSYEYHIKNIPLKELTGVRTIVPVAFIHDDRYFIGIHRDKLLSNPKILYEKNSLVTDGLNNMWQNVVQNLYDESMRQYTKIDLEKANILNTLYRRERMSEDSKNFVKEKTSYHINRVR